MTDVQDDSAAPATQVPLRGISALWLIPLVTVLVGAGMLYSNWSSRGPLIVIEFSSAAGLEAGETVIRTLDVDVGRVEDITFNETFDGVIVHARINDEFRQLLTADARFWVVRPTVTLAGISGLNTLITGQYIHFQPGEARTRAARFVGLEDPPVTPAGTPGLRVNLMTDGDYSFAKGDMIQYQGIRVGTIEDVELDLLGQQIYYDAFIEAPYHQLITAQTRFWKASGIHAELTSDGFELDTGTLNSMLQGGVSFTTPPGQLGSANDGVADNTQFYVYPSRSSIDENVYVQGMRYHVLVKGSIAGLNAGSPVMYRGVRIGQVSDTNFVYQGRNLLDRSVDIPVLIEINPGRLGLPDTEDGVERASADINEWISQGLIATLKSQNLLLGAQIIELEYDEAAAPSELTMLDNVPVIPTGQDTIARFTQSLEELLARVNELPVEELMMKFGTLLDEGSATMVAVQNLAASGETLLGSEGNVELFEQLNGTLSSVETLAQSFSEESTTSSDLRNLLVSLTALVDEFRPLLTELKNRPNALIFSTSQEPEPVPTRKQP